jgi:uncharacterized membrane protein
MKKLNKKNPLVRLLMIIFFLGAISFLMWDVIQDKSDTASTIKNIIASLFVLFGAIGAFTTNTDKESKNKYKDVNLDERDELIKLNSGNMVSNILFWLFVSLEVLSITLWCLLRTNELLVLVVIFGLFIPIKLILSIVCSIYYEKNI